MISLKIKKKPRSHETQNLGIPNPVLTGVASLTNKFAGSNAFNFQNMTCKNNFSKIFKKKLGIFKVHSS